MSTAASMDHALAARWVFISVWTLLEVDSKTSLPENLVGSSGVAVWEVVMWLREEAATDDPMLLNQLPWWAEGT